MACREMVRLLKRGDRKQETGNKLQFNELVDESILVVHLCFAHPHEYHNMLWRHICARASLGGNLAGTCLDCRICLRRDLCREQSAEYQEDERSILNNGAGSVPDTCLLIPVPCPLSPHRQFHLHGANLDYVAWLELSLLTGMNTVAVHPGFVEAVQILDDDHALAECDYGVLA
jgi:hypothetical protein